MKSIVSTFSAVAVGFVIGLGVFFISPSNVNAGESIPCNPVNPACAIWTECPGACEFPPFTVQRKLMGGSGSECVLCVIISVCVSDCVPT